MERCADCGKPVAGQGFVVQRQVDGHARKVLICIWCHGSPEVDAIRARSKAQAAQTAEDRIDGADRTEIRAERAAHERRTELRIGRAHTERQ